jgi:hypothetical protein
MVVSGLGWQKGEDEQIPVVSRLRHRDWLEQQIIAQHSSFAFPRNKLMFSLSRTTFNWDTPIPRIVGNFDSKPYK